MRCKFSEAGCCQLTPGGKDVNCNGELQDRSACPFWRIARGLER